MKAGLITTIDTNIGDDFIRIGIQRVLREVVPETQWDWVYLNKHVPAQVWPPWHPNRWIPPWAPNWRRLALKMGLSRFHGCDVIAQCGAPVIWKKCKWCEWNLPIWQEVVRDLHTRIPVMNLAIGSAYPLSALPDRIASEEDRDYIRSILGYCRLTTARDRLAQQLVAELGVDIPLIPCSAGLAGEVQNAKDPTDTVFVNYMKKAGHSVSNDDIDEAAWDHVMDEVIAHISKSFQVVFLCHDEAERNLAKARFPEFKRELPANPKAYFEIARRGYLGLFNRLHAAVAFAGMGIPSIAVGNDSRLLMVEEYGLPVFDVRHCSADAVLAAFDSLVTRRNEERQRLVKLRAHIQTRYVHELSRVLKANA